MGERVSRGGGGGRWARKGQTMDKSAGRLCPRGRGALAAAARVLIGSGRDAAAHLVSHHRCLLIRYL